MGPLLLSIAPCPTQCDHALYSLYGRENQSNVQPSGLPVRLNAELKMCEVIASGRHSYKGLFFLFLFFFCVYKPLLYLCLLVGRYVGEAV